MPTLTIAHHPDKFLTMGHDVVMICGRHDVFSDSVLWELRRFLVEESTAVATSEKTVDAQAVAEYFESWNWVCNGVFGGIHIEVIDPKSPAFVPLVLKVIDGARQRIVSHGDSVPCAQLPAHLEPPAHFKLAFRDYMGPIPVEPLLRDLDRLAALFRDQPN